VPSVSKKQHNFMAAVANNPSFAKKAGVPQSVGQDFAAADKGKKFGASSRADLQGVNKPKTDQGKNKLFNKGGEMKESKAMVKKEVSFMKKKGAPASMVKHEAAEMGAMKKGGMPMVMKAGKKVPAFAVKKMASGGITSAKMGKVPSGGFKGHGEHSIQKQGISKGTQIKMSGSKPLGMKKGGKAC
jgi:hypothetical protein